MTCDNTSINQQPIYPGIMAHVPGSHAAMGHKVALSLTKKPVMAGMGMSNAKQEFQAFMDKYRAKYGRSRPVTTVNLGTGNWDLTAMVHDSEKYWDLVHETMAKKKTSPERIEIVVFKNSVRHQDKPYPDDVWEYLEFMEDHLANMTSHLPNLKMLFVLSAVYSGYASVSAPRHEPWAFREGLAVDEFVRDHWNMTEPWITWGPYYWANGLEPRDDGLTWKCTDFMAKDGVHPGTGAKVKTADMLMRFFEQYPWFTGVSNGV